MREIKEKYSKEEFEEYITNPGAFANENGKMLVTLPRGSTALNTKDTAAFNKLGDTYGCHHCGTLDPGFMNWVKDHMTPTALLVDGKLQFFLPSM